MSNQTNKLLFFGSLVIILVVLVLIMGYFLKSNNDKNTGQNYLSENSAYECVKGDYVVSIENDLYELPECVDGRLKVDFFSSGMVMIELPIEVTGNLVMSPYTKADNVIFPEKVGGSVYLNNLVDSNVVLPREVGRHLFLNDLKNLNKTTLPEVVGGDLFMRKVTTATVLVLPKKTGAIFLNRLLNVKKLILPEYVEGGINLKRLKTVSGITFPKEITGKIRIKSFGTQSDIDKLTDYEKEKIIATDPVIR